MKESAPREHNRHTELDKLAKEGHFAANDLPATDAYDDGLNELGKLVRPGSTSTEAGGTYMEDVGPQSEVRRQHDEETIEAKAGSRVIGVDDLKQKSNIYKIEHDPMDRKRKAVDDWLRENDPNHPDYKKAA